MAEPNHPGICDLLLLANAAASAAASRSPCDEQDDCPPVGPPPPLFQQAPQGLRCHAPRAARSSLLSGSDLLFLPGTSGNNPLRLHIPPMAPAPGPAAVPAASPAAASPAGAPSATSTCDHEATSCSPCCQPQDRQQHAACRAATAGDGACSPYAPPARVVTIAAPQPGGSSILHDGSSTQRHSAGQAGRDALFGQPWGPGGGLSGPGGAGGGTGEALFCQPWGGLAGPRGSSSSGAGGAGEGAAMAGPGGAGREAGEAAATDCAWDLTGPRGSSSGAGLRLQGGAGEGAAVAVEAGPGEAGGGACEAAATAAEGCVWSAHAAALLQRSHEQQLQLRRRLGALQDRLETNRALLRRWARRQELAAMRERLCERLAANARQQVQLARQQAQLQAWGHTLRAWELQEDAVFEAAVSAPPAVSVGQPQLLLLQPPPPQAVALTPGLLQPQQLQLQPQLQPAWGPARSSQGFML